MGGAVEPTDRMEFESFARVCELHPELLDRFIALGLVEMWTDANGRRWIERGQVAAVGRVRRLRSGLHLSYSAIAVVAPLIDRLDELEAELRRLEAVHHVEEPRRPCIRVELPRR